MGASLSNSPEGQAAKAAAGKLARREHRVLGDLPQCANRRCLFPFAGLAREMATRVARVAMAALAALGGREVVAATYCSSLPKRG